VRNGEKRREKSDGLHGEELQGLKETRRGKRWRRGGVQRSETGGRRCADEAKDGDVAHRGARGIGGGSERKGTDRIWGEGTGKCWR
jgi:hypothetical protein